MRPLLKVLEDRAAKAYNSIKSMLQPSSFTPEVNKKGLRAVQPFSNGKGRGYTMEECIGKDMLEHEASRRALPPHFPTIMSL